MNISKSLFNYIMKSLGKDPKFEELKAEVIELLKKQAKSEKEDFKKSVLANENKYSYIVKSVTGEFIVKSGYPVGTIREWKGKKYMKISPTKWVRKYDKEGRGTSISAGKLIKRVEKCENPQQLLQLVLANKQRFSDENGKLLPIVDKIRAAVDKKNDSFSSGKDNNVATKKNESSKNDAESKTDVSKMNNWKAPETIEELSKDKNPMFKAELKNGKLIIGSLQNGRTLKQYKATLFKDLPANKKFELSKLEKEGKFTAGERSNVFERDGKFYLLKKGKGLNKVGDYSYSNTDSIIDLSQETEAEKHANRSEGMKGNQNAKKDGVSEELKKDIKNKLSEITDKTTSKTTNGYEKYKNILDRLKMESDLYKKNFNSNDESDDVKTYRKDFTQKVESLKKEFEVKSELKKKLAEQLKDVTDEQLQHALEILKKEPDYTNELENTINSDIINYLVGNRNLSNPDNPFNQSVIRNIAEHIFYKQPLKEFKKEILEKELKKRKETKDSDSKSAKSTSNLFKAKDSVDIESLKPVGPAEAMGDDACKIAYSKELDNAIKSLLNCCSKDKYRAHMMDVFYNDGNLIATDSLKLKIVKVGKLPNISEDSYVSVESGKDGIIIKNKSVEGLEGRKFPTYKRVIPETSSNDKNFSTFNFDNTKLKEKIKTMKKDGSITKINGKSPIAIETKGDKVLLDGEVIGTVSNPKDDTSHIVVPVESLTNVLSGETSIMKINQSDKPLNFATESTIDVVMPMTSESSPNYEENRKNYSEKNSQEEEIKKQNLEEYEKEIKKYSDNISDERISQVIEKVKSADKETIQHNLEQLKLTEKYIKNPTKKKFDFSKFAENKQGIALLASMRRNPTLRTEFDNAVKKYGLKKSFFDTEKIRNSIEKAFASNF